MSSHTLLHGGEWLDSRTRFTRTHFHRKLIPNARTYFRKGGRLDGSPITRSSSAGAEGTSLSPAPG
eukprot:7789348-Pyramimonas_sp.AAC.1